MIMQATMPNSSPATAKMKSVAVGQDALDRALARALAEPAAAHQRLAPHVDLEGVALAGQEAVDAAGHVREGRIGHQRSRQAADAADEHDPQPGMPAMKNIAPQVPITSSVWPRSGCATSSASTSPSRIMARDCPECRDCAPFSLNSQAQMTTKAGFRYSEGCIETPAR
jgi:hypothetical protein